MSSRATIRQLRAELGENKRQLNEMLQAAAAWRSRALTAEAKLWGSMKDAATHEIVKAHGGNQC